SSYGYLVFVDYYSTGELTCFLFSETKKDASDFSPTSYIIEPFNKKLICAFSLGAIVSFFFKN
ncbi:hypothetical protein ACEN32_11515, partial [Marinilactibacillus psychrotolerans]|uniref:hypothetical protein n=1 Tax=Marinilactibacillus psychrotolerans TaxID=191770 RepID=UPI00388A6426